MQHMSSSRIQPVPAAFQQQRPAPMAASAALATLRAIAISLLVDRALSA